MVSEIKGDSGQNISGELEYKFEIILNIAHRLIHGAEERCLHRHPWSEKSTQQTHRKYSLN